MTAPSAENEAHRREMESMQESMHAKIRAAREKKGLLIVHTGNGKGKTTAAFGMLTRMLAHGRRCAVVQFIKSSNDAVAKLLASPNLHWSHFGEGFTWDTKDREADIACCRAGWEKVKEHLADPEIAFLLLDELNVVLAFDYLPRTEVLATLQARREELHVVVTGRDAHPALIEQADLVTEMREIKHPFASGIQAQRGIEF